MTTELRKRVFYGCQRHADAYYSGCENCLISTVTRLTDEVERLEKQWEERLNGNFEQDRFTIIGDSGESIDTEYNRGTFRTEAAIVQYDVEQEKLTVDQARRLGYLKGPISGIGIEPSGPLSTPVDSNRPVGEREDSVGRRRRRQEFDGLGILPEEGGDQ